MKKILIGAALSVCAISVQAANYSAAGCGLGSKLFEGQTGVGPHVLAATTNGSYGTQTFAMTSGTLGCDVSTPINSNMAYYIDNNLESIAQASAQGQGEALDVLAELMGVGNNDIDVFNMALKDNFADIFSRADVTSVEVMNALVNVMKADANLAKYVS